jgi:hypothetical protein
LEIKSVVVHFQDKTVNPEWKTTNNLHSHREHDQPGKSQTGFGEGPTDKEGG